MLWQDLLPTMRWWDVVDILLVAVIIYYAFFILKGTRALQVFFSVAFLFFLFWLSQAFEIRTLGHVLGSLFDHWILILVVLFHQEIRRALSKLGTASLFSNSDRNERSQILEELVKSCVSLANKKIGALLVLEREANVLEFVEAGVHLDSKLSKEALTSIFLPVSPLHDGACILRNGRIFMAGCFLPLTLNPLVSQKLGTRHRAALGLTEETDALCIVISEETGSISFAANGRITHHLDGQQLRKTLLEYLQQKG